jgi:hypothetical protein
MKQALFTAIVDSNFLNLPNDVLFPVGIKETNNNVPSSLLIRTFHEDMMLIVDQLISNNAGGCVFFGPPGIGKSWSAMYLLWKLIVRNERLEVDKRQSVIYFDSGGQRAWVFGTDRCVRINGISAPNEVDIPELMNRTAVLMYDAVAGDGQAPLVILPARYIIFASPNAGNCKQVERSKGLARMICPNWTINELQLLAARTSVPLSSEEIQLRYERFGGSPRLVIANDPKVSEQIIQDAIQEWESKSFWFGSTSSQWLVKAVYETAIIDETPFDKYNGLNVSWDYACERFKNEVHEKYNRADEETKRRFQNWLHKSQKLPRYSVI